MKQTLFLALLLLTQSCAQLPFASGGTFSNAECAEKPTEALKEDDIELTYLSQGSVKKSGQVSAGRPRGYSFEGKAQTELHHSSQDNVCIWVYAPNGDLVSDNQLTLDGMHTVQVEALQGSTSYTVDLSMGGDRAEPSRAPSTEQDNSPEPEPKRKKEAPSQKAKAECGSGKPTKSERRYRVLARGQILETIKSKHCKDAFVRGDSWIQVASFNSEKGAKTFIEEKKAAVGGTWKTETYWYEN